RPRPSYLCRPPGSVRETRELKKMLRNAGLHTVCEEARCPNIADCFSRRTLTFLILGDVCSRNCRSCSVKHGISRRGVEPEAEADRVAAAAAVLKLQHVVVTSVTRDDLPDGGASAFALTVRALHNKLPDAAVELLIPDLRGCHSALSIILESRPDVLGHNLETVPRLYGELRPQADYWRSLAVLERAKQCAPGIFTKTGIMLGLGETPVEVRSLMRDARSAGVDIFTAGQYLQPERRAAKVVEYLALEQYDQYRSWASAEGFSHAMIGPLVRSSYHAGQFCGTERKQANGR
ncbi:MAG TPA: lipoyl synthase, partial [Oligoflexia bacterium]|nr:lipoyl synthase [Oligoflexia bacterium]